VPWAFDEEAVEVARRFIHLKLRLMPYLWGAAIEATETGLPIMRSMVLEFPHDPAVPHLDRQYMLGSDILVAPVFEADGGVDFYLPDGRWTSLLTGEVAFGPAWRRETHAFDSLPVYVREGSVIPWGSRDDVADYDYLSGLTLLAFPSRTRGHSTLRVISTTGHEARFSVEHAPGRMRITGETGADWVARVLGGDDIRPVDGVADLRAPASADERGGDR
jgi:alpha-D-xyloside xylohydrolase